MSRFHPATYHYRAPPQAPLGAPLSDAEYHGLLIQATAALVAVAAFWGFYL